MFNEKNYYETMLKAHNESGGFGFNRSITSRYFTAANKHAKRLGWDEARDNFTDWQLMKMVCEHDYCPVCGFGFNSFTRTDDDGYNWEIAHRDPNGHFTYNNLMLLHKRCNGCQYQDTMDFWRGNTVEGVNCYLDFLAICLEDGRISRKDKLYKNYFKLMDDICNGYDPRTSGGR